MKFNSASLNKLEKVLQESGYILRYERGSFQSGYCLLEEKKVVVLNKFLNTEGRINTLIDIISNIAIQYDALTLESQRLYDSIKTANLLLE